MNSVDRLYNVILYFYQMKELQEKNCLLQEQVGDLEKKLSEARATCRENETKLAAENFKVQEHLNTIERYPLNKMHIAKWLPLPSSNVWNDLLFSLQKELKKLETTDWKVEEKRLFQEAEDLRREIESHQKEQEGLRKVHTSIT